MGIFWCIGLLGGLGLARLGMGSSFWWAVLLFAWGFALRRKYRLLYVAMTTLAMVCVGLWRGTIFIQHVNPYAQLNDTKVAFTATVDSDAIYSKQGQLSFTVRNIEFQHPIRARPPGVIRVQGYGELAVFKGDVVRVKGKIRAVRGSIQGAVYFAQFSRIDSKTSVLNDMLRRFTAGVRTAIAEPAASFGMGILIGQRSTLPQENLDALKMVGLMHIVAVSGYNLTIILNFAKRVCERFSKRLTVSVALSLMAAFLVCTGMSASIVRASVVSSLGLLAWYVGRRVRPLLLILFAASITAFVYPVYLWSDIGWYLSFLAFFGILIVAPLIVDRIWKGKSPHILAAVMIETLCAELMTIPLILYIFGQISSVGLLANVLVVVLIPIAMLLTFAAGILGWFAPLVSGWIGWPAEVLLTYMLDVATMLSRVPHAFTTGKYIHFYDMIGVYIVVCGIVYVMTRRKAWHETWNNFYTTEREKGIL